MISIPRNANCSYNAKDANVTTSMANDGIMWFLMFAMPMVAIFGMIGNLFSFVILKESALKNVSHLYLVSLSIFDSITLITVMYSFYGKVVFYPTLVKIGVYSPTLHYLYNAYSLCHFRMYSTFVMRLISVWTIVLFSVDRFIAMVFPMRSRSLSTVRNTLISMSVLIAVSLLISMPWLFAYRRVNNPCLGIVECKSTKVAEVLVLVQFIFLTVVPSIIICTCNITIVCILRRRQSHSTLISKKEAMNQEKLITIRLLLVSTAFVVLTFPSLVIISINQEYKSRNDLSYKRGHNANALHMGIFLFTVNLSINFLLYCLTGPNFRRAAWSMLCCRYDKMQFYRRVILNPNITTDTNVTDLTDPNCRSGSISSEKNHVLVNLSKNPSVAMQLKSGGTKKLTTSSDVLTTKALLDSSI